MRYSLRLLIALLGVSLAGSACESATTPEREGVVEQVQDSDEQLEARDQTTREFPTER